MQEKLAKIIQKITINCDKLSNLAPTHLETKIMYDYILYIYIQKLLVVSGSKHVPLGPKYCWIYTGARGITPNAFHHCFSIWVCPLKKPFIYHQFTHWTCFGGSPQTPRTLRKDPRHASRPKSPRRFSAKMSFTRLLQWIKTCRGKFWCLDSPMWDIDEYLTVWKTQCNTVWS